MFAIASHLFPSFYNVTYEKISQFSPPCPSFSFFSLWFHLFLSLSPVSNFRVIDRDRSGYVTKSYSSFDVRDGISYQHIDCFYSKYPCKLTKLDNYHWKIIISYILVVIIINCLLLYRVFTHFNYWIDCENLSATASKIPARRNEIVRVVCEDLFYNKSYIGVRCRLSFIICWKCHSNTTCHSKIEGVRRM